MKQEIFINPNNVSLYAVLGDPVSHSKSPLMHNTAFRDLNMNALYLAFMANTKNLEEVTRSLLTLGFKGFNLTMPNKELMAKLCFKLVGAAKLIGSVNTVKVEDNHFIGYSTDGSGFFLNLKANGVDIKNKKLLLFGCGGAAKAIAAQAVLEDVKSLKIVNRSLDKALKLKAMIAPDNSNVNVYDLNYKNLEELVYNSDILIQATNVGMGESKTIIPSSYLNPNSVLAEIIYKPEETRLMIEAKEKGLKVIGGKGMLLYQGAEAFKIWTGRDFPVKKVSQVLFA